MLFEFYPQSEILIYQTEDGETRIDVRIEGETVWLSQAQMVELFQTSKQNISLHIKNIFLEAELNENSVVKEYLITATDGKNYKTKFYNLDVIISVGYRVKSHRGTQFRIWATQRLKEYIIKGFTMNDELLKKAGGGNYFDELLERIRDIRSSEKVESALSTGPKRIPTIMKKGTNKLVPFFTPSPGRNNGYALRSQLSWTHYRLLMRIEKDDVRSFYLDECIRNNWSTRQLERQINSFYSDILEYRRLDFFKKRYREESSSQN
jgi:hypothetical protein